MNHNKIKMKIVMDCLIAAICFVAIFFLKEKEAARYVLGFVGFLWLMAAALNFTQLKK